MFGPGSELCPDVVFRKLLLLYASRLVAVLFSYSNPDSFFALFERDVIILT